MLPGPAVAELVSAVGTACEDLRDAMAIRCQRLAQQLIVVKAAAACDDDLHEDLPRVLDVPNKKSSPLPRCLSEGCVLQRHAGVAGLPMASSEGVG